MPAGILTPTDDDMNTHIIRPALVALAFIAFPALSSAQAPAHHGGMHHGAGAEAPSMKTPCPLHLTDLGTTPAQDSAIARIREAHMAEMKGMHSGHAADSSSHHAAMEAQMKPAMAKALADVRAVLDEPQRQRFDAAVAAHEAEKAAMKRDGRPHECGACCRMHEKAGAARHEH